MSPKRTPVERAVLLRPAIQRVTFDLTPSAGPPPAGVKHVQDSNTGNIISTAGTITFPAATTVGDMLIAFFDVNLNIGPAPHTGLPVPSGGGVTTWALASFPTTGTACYVAAYYGLVTSGGSSSISWTNPTSNFVGAIGAEFSGVANTLVDHVIYDTSPHANPIPVGPVTPTAVGQLAIFAQGNNTGGTASPYHLSSPWTAGPGIAFGGPAGEYGALDWLITTSTAALSATYNYSGSISQSSTAALILAAA